MKYYYLCIAAILLVLGLFVVDDHLLIVLCILASLICGSTYTIIHEIHITRTRVFVTKEVLDEINKQRNRAEDC